MISAGYNFFQQYKREDVTGAIYYALMWTTASFGDVIIQNPKFKLSESSESNIVNENVAIYCVHGTGDRNNSFSYLIDKSMQDRKGLPQNISLAHLSAFDGRYQGNNIEFFAQQLLEKIILQGHKNVILMGHSRGGLVCAYLAEYLAKSAGINVCCVIPICSPFMGTSLANNPISSVSESVKEMVPDSVFLKNLQESILHSTTPYLYIAAEKDAIVPPESCCLPQFRESMTLIKRHGHLSVMYSAELASILQDQLSNLFKIEAIAESKVESIGDIKKCLMRQTVFSGWGG